MAITQTTEMQQYLRSLNYPVYKKDLLLKAENLGANDETLELIFSLPTQKYQSPLDVREAIEALSTKPARFKVWC